MKGVQFVVDEQGAKQAVLIDLREHGQLWEDFYDAMIAEQRTSEPTEPLEVVKRRVLGDEG
jgi:hypothetical protein